MKRLLVLVLLVSVTGCPPASNPTAPLTPADDSVAVDPPQARVIRTPDGSGALATGTREAFGQLGTAAVRLDMERVQAMILAGQAHHLKEGTEFLVLRRDDLCSYGEVRSGSAAGMRLWVMSESLTEPPSPTAASSPTSPPATGSPPKAVAKAGQPTPEPEPQHDPETVRQPKSAAGKVSGYWYASSLFRFMSREESAMRQQHGGKWVEISNGTCPLILLRVTADGAGQPVAFFGCGEFVDPEDGTDYSAWRIRATLSPRGERTLAGLRLIPVTVPFVRGILGGRTGTIIDMTECELQTPEERAQEGRDEAERVRQVPQPISQKEAAAAKQRQAEAEAAARRAEAESPQGREEAAARELRLARRLIDDARNERKAGNRQGAEKMLGRAADRLRQIAKQYPETKAAKDASALLEEMD